MNAVDTNVLVYSIDVREPVKQAKARELVRRLNQSAPGLIIPWQAAGELLANLRRGEDAGRFSRADVLSYAANLVALAPIVLPTLAILGKSLDLSGRYSLSHWDSMLVAACLQAGVTVLYSEDMQDGAMYDSLRIVNPFK